MKGKQQTSNRSYFVKPLELQIDGLSNLPDRLKFEAKDRWVGMAEWFDKSSVRNRKRHHWVSITLIVLTSVSTGLSAIIAGGGSTSIAFLTFGLGIIEAIAQGIEKLFKFEKTYIEHRTKCQMILAELHMYVAQTGDYKSLPVWDSMELSGFDLCSERIEAIDSDSVRSLLKKEPQTKANDSNDMAVSPPVDMPMDGSFSEPMIYPPTGIKSQTY